MKKFQTLVKLSRAGALVSLLAMLLACESLPLLRDAGGVDVVGDGDGPGDGDGDQTTTIDPTTDPGDGDNGDGDGDNGDGDGDVPDPVCDNGLLEIGEICDDGIEDGEGCSDDCLDVDPDYLCLEEGEACIRVVTCGNGVIEGNEACDDGETEDGDGCSAACDEVQDGWQCVKPGEPCVELAVCGNGTRERGEQCEDGQDPPVDGDGCDEECQLEDDTGLVWECPPTGPCVEVECGDGVRARVEGCDDNDNDNGDGCSEDCEVEPGFRCSSSGCRAICGDGQILGGEQCDDGDPDMFVAPVSGDGCSSSCREETNWNCTGEPSVCTTTIICGNGTVDPGEVCDPGGRNGAPVNPGQATCYDWNSSNPCGGFADVIPEPVCDNNVLEPGEACDGGSACINNCTAVTPGWECPAVDYCIEIPVCGDGKIQKGETCDSGPFSIAGCGQPESANPCQITNGYFCVGEPSDCVLPVCGDNVRQGSEQCDYDRTLGSKANGDGCSSTCTLETGWACPPGKACVPVCGNGRKDGDEQCDDNNKTNGDGCSSACQIERNGSGTSYDCGPNGLGPCVLAVCGNYNPTADGNNTGGDDQPEHGEGCDDGNTIAGDGCGPTCQKEPTVTVGTNPTVTTTCGDGILIKTGTNTAACSDGNPANNAGCAEVCDDGNTNNGDGCTNECRVETGWSCVDTSQQPSLVSLKIKYRDFRGRWVDVDSSNRVNLSGGHPQFGYYDTSEFNGGRQANIVGALCTAAGGTCGRLDSAGKPLLNTSGTILGPVIPDDGSPFSADAFGLWYRSPENKAGANNSTLSWGGGIIQVFDMGEASSLSLTRQGTTDTYVYANTSFYPVDGQAFGNTPNLNTTSHNFHFTSEMRYFFKYEKRPDPNNVGQLLGQELQFYGDDDVWVFVNGRLAVDIGGVHGQEMGRVVLGDEDASCASTSATPPACVLSSAEQADLTDNRFNITEGNLYEIVVFQAERSPTESNYKLTLSGFLPPRSSCTTQCGDEKVGGPETCDEGSGAGNTGGDQNRNNEYGACRTDCTFAFCGDGVNDAKLSLDPADPESCDNGRNVDLYSTTHKTLAAITSSGLCAPACELPAYCGDGEIDFAFGEECDEGEGQNNGGYGGCTSSCKLAPYCGDGATNGPETCDCGPGSDAAECPNGQFESYSETADGCGYDCQPAPYCGDDIRNGSENCDGTDVSGSRVCNNDCDYDAVCGDGLKNNDEECDHGVNNAPQGQEPGYEGCSYVCTLGPNCGDGNPDLQDGEECDLGEDLNTGMYDGCTDACLEGPHCGDAVLQSQADEKCDNGFNEDEYAYPGVTDACGPECTEVPYCGDDEVQDAFEFCDDGEENSDTKYDGCTTQCVYGPYCGDGQRDEPEEQCDDGKDNVAYSADGEGCGYDCKPSPYCGDGVRNGPEQCDLGTEDNDGSYNGCKKDCTRAPYCGDYKVQEDEGEECDEGINGSAKCSNKCQDREGIIH